MFRLFRREGDDETIPEGDETIFCLFCRTPETTRGYQHDGKDGRGQRRSRPGEICMRAASLILAFAFVISGSTMAGSASGGLPGIGTFAYTGSPITAYSSLVFASR